MAFRLKPDPRTGEVPLFSGGATGNAGIIPVPQNLQKTDSGLEDAEQVVRQKRGRASTIVAGRNRRGGGDESNDSGLLTRVLFGS